MSEMKSNRNQERKYTWILFLVIGLTAFSSAVKEWRHIVTITQQVGELISAFTNAAMPTASARTPRHIEIWSINNVEQGDDNFRWNGTVAPGQSIEIKGISGDIAAEQSSSNQVEVIAVKTARRSDVNTVQVKMIEHAGGVTICAVYRNEDGSSSTCEPGAVQNANRSSSGVNVHNNDVRVDFVVRVPRGVGFVGHTVNGDISATSLSSNVICRTVNGSIKISTTGYAEAATVNGEIFAKLGDGNWSGALAFKTVNGGITVDLPKGLSTDVEAQTLNGAIVSDFPLNLETISNRKHVKAKIGIGGRELLLKTLNGSINLRSS